MRHGKFGDGHHTPIVVEIAKFLKPRVYVEIGLGNHKNFKAVSQFAEEPIGVDIPPGSDKFFEDWPEGKEMDLVFIDGDHMLDQAWRDFENSIKRLSRYGIIVLHDTWPPRRSFEQRTRCGHVWQVPALIKEHYPDLDMVTLPICRGITIVRHHNCPAWTEEKR